MRKMTAPYIAIGILCLFGLLTTVFNAHTFIERRYSLDEVIKESTNVLFGTVTSIDKKRMTATVKVGENLKGKSDYEEIKINIAVGQGNFPKKLMEQLDVGLPMIVFYAKHGSTIDSLGHVNGTWFQIRAQDGFDRSRVWWQFTHIEIYMHRTYKGTTPDFQTLLRHTLLGGAKPAVSKSASTQDLSKAPAGTVRVLVLTGNHTDAEFPALSEFGEVGRRGVVYQQTKDRNLPYLGDADILWIGQGEICETKYVLTNKQEGIIKTFVENGGVVIVSGQDSDDDRPCDTGWLPEPLKGIERWGRSDLQPTSAAGILFREPNTIKSGDVFIDDTWEAANDKYTILATTNGGKEIAVAQLTHGKGMYLITSFQNETRANVFVNTPMMENLIHFAVKWLAKE